MRGAGLNSVVHPRPLTLVTPGGAPAAAPQLGSPRPHDDGQAVSPALGGQQVVWSVPTRGLDLGPRRARTFTLPSTVTQGDDTVLDTGNLISNRAHPGSTTTAILPFGRGTVNLDRPPLLLVHGMFGNLEHFGAIAEQAERQGRQVFVAKYDTGAVLPHDAAAQLAARLAKIRELYRPDTRPMNLDIVSHSMGGPVVRLLLESGALGDDTTVRWVAVDAPWGGRPSKWYDAGAAIFGGDSLVIDALRPEAELFGSRLYARPLDAEKVSYVSVASTDDFVVSLSNASDQQLRSVLGAVVAGPEGDETLSPMVRNLVRNLRTDARYSDLRSWVLAHGATQLDHFRAHLAKEGFVLEGGHNSVLRNHRLLTEVFSRWLSPAPKPTDLDNVLEVTDPLYED